MKDFISHSKASLFILSSLLFLKVSGQDKPNLLLKKLTLATYKVSGSGSNKKVDIQDVIEINNSRVRHISKFYKGISDTTYALPESAIERLNAVFNGKMKLKSRMIATKMAHGYYGGSPIYLSYINADNVTDELIIIPPLMDDLFNKAFDAITRLPADYIHVKYQAKSIKNEALEKVILKENNSTTYLDNIQSPPPAN